MAQVPVVDPGLALLVFAILLLGGAVLAWPRRGLLARLARLRRMTLRVRAEDAIKYLYHSGSDGRPVRPEALAGALGVGAPAARHLLNGLVTSGLAEPQGVGFALTDTGRRDALRLVRAHRLLERYFADQTGVSPAEWHELAEDAEHQLTEREAEQLAARLGQPRFDPHGDPIPTAAGELPDDMTLYLGALGLDEPGIVAHLEDEPAEAYGALEAAGIGLGSTVVVRARDAERLALEVDGAPRSLPRWVEPAVNLRRAVAVPREAATTLADLAPGAMGVVRGLSPLCRGAQRRRLLDLGVVPGTAITAVLRSAGGDPVAYDVRGALIALRRQQAVWVELEPAGADAP
jgi:DtxR family transcriptional regulator, Mn-dependent transcriptional regulator